MGAENFINQEQVQQKFEGILERKEGNNVLGETDVDDQYRASVTKLLGMIDKNSYLEPPEKQKLKSSVLKQVAQDLDSLDTRLDNLARSQDNDTQSARLLLYQQSVVMVNDINTFLGRQIDRAADYYVIMDDEFSAEVLGQIPYLRSGLPRLDALAKAEMGKGSAPHDAMQKAIDQFLAMPGKLTVFNLELLSKRYPDLRLPDQTFDCVRIQGTENLRDLNTSKVVRPAANGETLQVIQELPPQGKYRYAAVMDRRGNQYKICLNDGDHVTSLQFSKGKYQVLGTPSVTGEPLPESTTVLEPLRTLVQKGYSTVEGVLTSLVNPLQLGQILPAMVQEATVIFHNATNGARIPLGKPVQIVREGDQFVFAGECAGCGRSDGRVRVLAGDQIELKPVVSSTPVDSPKPAEKVETLPQYQEVPSTVAAYWQWMRGNWEAPNVIDKDKQDKAVCAGYVQRTLEGIYGHDFTKDLFIDGDHFVDAWQMASRIETKGYGHMAMDFSRYYQVDAAKGSIHLDDKAPGYSNDVVRLLNLAATNESQTGLLFFHYKHTRANPNILANLNDGGSLNSHAVLILGLKGRSMDVSRDNASLATSLIDSMKLRLGESYDNSWEANRPLLGTLKNVKLNGVPVQFQDGEFRDATGAVLGVKAGDKVTYQDVQVTDFYHNHAKPNESPARVVGLTELMIQGNFEPVKLAQWNSEYVNNQMPEKVPNFVVGEFRMDSSITDLPAAIRQHYEAIGQTNPDFLTNNPNPDEFVKRTMDFLQYVHVILSPEALPINGARIPILDWSKYPKASKVQKVQSQSFSVDAAYDYLKSAIS